MYREALALKLRDRAVEIAKKRGTLADVGLFTFLTVIDRDLRIDYRMPRRDGVVVEFVPQFGIDVWFAKRVLSVHWDRSDFEVQR